MIQHEKKFQVGDLVRVNPPSNGGPVGHRYHGSYGLILKIDQPPSKHSYYKETCSLVMLRDGKYKIRNSILEKVNK